MTISEPAITGRFFSYPADAQSGTVAPYWIAAGGLRMRMSAASRRAFCAVLEAVLERATIPTLTDDNWSETMADLDEVSPGSGRMQLVMIPRTLSSSGARASIASHLVRGADDELWRAAIMSAFSLVGTKDPLELTGSWMNTLTVYPYVLGEFGGDTGGFVGSGAINVTVPCAMHETVWTDDGRSDNPLYTGIKTHAPHAMGYVMDELLRNVGSWSHTVTQMRAEECNLGALMRAQTALADAYDAEDVRNWWRKKTADRIAEGPSWITPRRSNVAYGITQYLLALMNRTVCRFRYRLDFLRTTRAVQTTYIMALDDKGVLKATPLGDPVDVTTTSHDSTLLFARARSLGGVVAKFPVKLSHPNSASSPLARTLAQLMEVEPRFMNGRLANVHIGTSGSAGLEPDGEGESGLLVCSRAVTNSSAGDGWQCMDVWPHPEAGEYVDEANAVLVDGVEDWIEQPDSGSRTPQGSVQSVRMVDGSGVDGLKDAIDGHAGWLVSNCGLSGVEIPEDVTPDDAYLAQYGAERSAQIYASYSYFSSPTVTRDGVTYYLPYAAVFGSLSGEFDVFSLVGDMWESHGQLVYAPDASKIWRDQTAVSEELTHSYGDGIGVVRWAWKAMPTADA